MRIAMILALALLSLTPAARAADLHRLWDEQCGGCHGHAGTFARASLRLVDGLLVGRVKGDRVVAYLERHNGGYSPEVIAAMQSMLRSQVETPDLFQRACAECHGLAAQFVRETIISSDGALYGRHSHRSVAKYLERHGGLTAAEAALMIEVLTRIEREVHQP